MIFEKAENTQENRMIKAAIPNASQRFPFII
jgi:hypothetical protein